MLHWDGLIIALLTILIIGVFHPVVIKTEYYFGCKAWPVFLITGLFLIAGSLQAANTVMSAVLAVPAERKQSAGQTAVIIIKGVNP